MKKKLNILLICFIILPQIIYGQVHYDYPKCNSQADNNIKIVRVLCDVMGTLIDFEYTRSESQGIYILLSPPNTAGAYYIKANGKTYKLTSTSGIGNKDGETKAYPNKPVLFSATFERLPISVKEFDLIEGKTGSWHFYGVQLKNPINNFNATSKPSNSTATISPNNFSTLDELKPYYIKNINNLDPIEGIWSFSIPTSIDLNRVAIMYKDNKFIEYVDYGNKGIFKLSPIYFYYKTASPNIYFYEIFYEKGSERFPANLVSKNIVKIDMGDFEITLIRLYPDEKIVGEANKYTQKSSGTGFAITSNGYIITCNHVIDDATSIKVKGINGNFTKAYTATVSSSDKNNDLAILKINDASFSSLGSIPYTIKTPTSDVGTSIFIMGYPLTATMGDEVKLTDGIISAKSGFTGDITSYQISAAAQPGNSGGPLFDKTGNLIGVVNAKHVKAENATYAVKSSYLKNLIESLPTSPVLQKVNTLTGKSLPEQVKLIKNFVYIIEVN